MEQDVALGLNPGKGPGAPFPLAFSLGWLCVCPPHSPARQPLSRMQHTPALCLTGPKTSPDAPTCPQAGSDSAQHSSAPLSPGTFFGVLVSREVHTGSAPCLEEQHLAWELLPATPFPLPSLWPFKSLCTADLLPGMPHRVLCRLHVAPCVCQDPEARLKLGGYRHLPGTVVVLRAGEKVAAC